MQEEERCQECKELIRDEILLWTKSAWEMIQEPRRDQLTWAVLWTIKTSQTLAKLLKHPMICGEENRDEMVQAIAESQAEMDVLLSQLPREPVTRMWREEESALREALRVQIERLKEQVWEAVEEIQWER
jgi:hypothetical protein